MPWDETIAARVRAHLSRRKGVEEKRMFGGLAFLWNGKLLVGVRRDSILLRVGLNRVSEFLRDPGFQEFRSRGKTMKGWMTATSETVADDAVLGDLVDTTIKFVESLEK